MTRPSTANENADTGFAPLLLSGDRLSCRLLAMLLGRLGYPSVSIASEIDSALEALEALACRAYPCVLVDLGSATVAALRQIAARSSARLIAVVGAADDEAVLHAAGAAAVLRRPVTLASLAAVLDAGHDKAADFDAETWADLRRLYSGTGLRELVAAAAAEVPIQGQRHAAAVAANDLRTLASVVHTLRGTCLQFGAADLAQLASRAEQAAQSGDTATALSASAELIERHGRLVALLLREAADD
ncbi:Hpt domain-containing protein [Nevskia sp.]|uniref:Hpt domain-containing protein n=1 Tax=Nevskia sp. TaxID=1929292 RepID=UPI003F6FFE46